MYDRRFNDERKVRQNGIGKNKSNHMTYTHIKIHGKIQNTVASNPAQSVVVVVVIQNSKLIVTKITEKILFDYKQNNSLKFVTKIYN